MLEFVLTGKVSGRVSEGSAVNQNPRGLRRNGWTQQACRRLSCRWRVNARSLFRRKEPEWRYAEDFFPKESRGKTLVLEN